MEPEFIEIEDNFLPDIVADPYRRKHIRTRFNIKEGQTRAQVEAACEQYIKEYIEKNTVYHSPNIAEVRNNGFEWSHFKAVGISNPYPPESTIPLEQQIMSCTELKVLESYKLIAKSKPELQQVYESKLKELQP